jgi:hypothetical protein
MSNYQTKAKRPNGTEYEKVNMLDDHYGKHEYGVEFPDGAIYPEKDCEVMDLGVSQRAELGKKYGYWDYFEKEVKKEILDEVMKVMPKKDNKTIKRTEQELTNDEIAYYDGWNCAIDYMEAEIEKLKQLYPLN